MILTFQQVLNEYFHNVCELDLVFNFYKVSTKLPTVLTRTKTMSGIDIFRMTEIMPRLSTLENKAMQNISSL